MKEIQIKSIGENKNIGNIIGVQPVMNEIDYSTAKHFSKKIESYIREAKKAGFISNKTVIVFPEYIGTWLVTVDTRAHKTTNIKQAMRLVAYKNPIGSLSNYFKLGNIELALFNARAKRMRTVYHETFSHLAKKYQIIIVAGSIVLPNPIVKNGKLTITKGNLYNVSVSYNYTGEAFPTLNKKVFLVEDEKIFTNPGSIDELGIIDTNIGKLGILICADSWFEESYNKIETLQAKLLVVPSFLYPDNAWKNHWKGDQEKNTTLSEKEAWLQYAMAGKLRKTKIKYGVNVFLRGSFWGLGSDGETTIMCNNQIEVIKDREVITNIWIND